MGKDGERPTPDHVHVTDGMKRVHRERCGIGASGRRGCVERTPEGMCMSGFQINKTDEMSGVEKDGIPLRRREARDGH